LERKLGPKVFKFICKLSLGLVFIAVLYFLGKKPGGSENVEISTITGFKADAKVKMQAAEIDEIDAPEIIEPIPTEPSEEEVLAYQDTEEATVVETAEVIEETVEEEEEEDAVGEVENTDEVEVEDVVEEVALGKDVVEETLENKGSESIQEDTQTEIITQDEFEKPHEEVHEKKRVEAAVEEEVQVEPEDSGHIQPSETNKIEALDIQEMDNDASKPARLGDPVTAEDVTVFDPSAPENAQVEDQKPIEVGSVPTSDEEIFDKKPKRDESTLVQVEGNSDKLSVPIVGGKAAHVEEETEAPPCTKVSEIILTQVAATPEVDQGDEASAVKAGTSAITNAVEGREDIVPQTLQAVVSQPAAATATVVQPEANVVKPAPAEVPVAKPKPVFKPVIKYMPDCKCHI
jgi:hypothetical protein